jgi:tRNA(Ile)-lysidine synthase
LALVALAAATHANFLVVHVDHGLRPGGAAEAEAVAAAAARFGLPMVATTAEVTPGPNLEARARAARYDALRALAAPAIAVAHTADDQAETVMINLLRGAALAGLAGMAPIRDDIHRPLLGLRRSDTEAICAAFGFEPFVDPTNADRRFLRNRVRLELLPQLESMASRDLVPVLARQATVLRSEHEFLDELAVAAWPTADDPHPETPRVADLVRLPEVLARRAVRRWLGSPPAALDEVDAVLTVARGGRVAVELAGRGRIARSQGRLFRR